MQSTARHHIKVLADQSVVGEWDKRRMRQVLMNLLSNALKYSPEGSTVTVSVAADERGATVRVRDEGLGLDGTELAQLFRRGYRAEGALNVTGGGLGLYFSNGIIAAHGGRMWAESLGHGQGSTFCFTLALREETSPIVQWRIAHESPLAARHRLRARRARACARGASGARAIACARAASGACARAAPVIVPAVIVPAPPPVIVPRCLWPSRKRSTRRCAP